MLDPISFWTVLVYRSLEYLWKRRPGCQGPVANVIVATLGSQGSLAVKKKAAQAPNAASAMQSIGTSPSALI